MEDNSISALTVSSSDTRCSCCSPRGRNHKYLLWLQSKVLSVPRFFFSAPKKTSVIQLHLNYTMLIWKMISFTFSTFISGNLSLMHSSALLCHSSADTRSCSTGCLFQLAPASLLHYLTGSSFPRCSSNSFLFSESSLHQQCSIAIAVRPSSGCASTRQKSSEEQVLDSTAHI